MKERGATDSCDGCVMQDKPNKLVFRRKIYPISAPPLPPVSTNLPQTLNFLAIMSTWKLKETFLCLLMVQLLFTVHIIQCLPLLLLQVHQQAQYQDSSQCF